MASFDRLSYLQSNEDSCVNDVSSLMNPCKNLTEVFNSICEDEVKIENLKVYLRLRPLPSQDTFTSHEGNIEIVDNHSIFLTAPNCSNAFKNNKSHDITKVRQKFFFSHVYDQETSQKNLFKETMQDLVKDLVNGQNCLMFSYGATNSGKTYTIQGTASQPGVLPRTLKVLFAHLGDQQYKKSDLKPLRFCDVVRLNDREALKEEETKSNLLRMKYINEDSLMKGMTSFQSFVSRGVDCSSVNSSHLEDLVLDETCGSECSLDGTVDLTSSSKAFYAVYVSFAEIYNEYIYDLLERNTLLKNVKKSPLTLGEDRNGAIYIKGLKEVHVSSASEALRILEVGCHNLHFAETRLNHSSSRSHCIFTIKLVRLADPSYPHVARVSMLSICDLAGAERAGKTLNSMDRLKEASNINTSLLVLGRCIAALRHNQLMNKQVSGPKKTMPIPYRDSKVTRLFQNFFMGKGKVAMIVNISTSSVLFDETLRVLKFSALARKVLQQPEKCSVADQTIEDQSKKVSRVARFMRNSFNSSSVSSHAPWQGRSFYDVTFGAGDSRESTKLLAVPEESINDESDERYDALLDLISKLKEKLLQECREKSQLETELRKEICDAFSQRIVQIEDDWRSRLEEERSRAEEFMDWRMHHVMEPQKLSTSRKRLRCDSGGSEDGEMVSSVLLVREEIKVKELEDEKERLEEELEALKLTLKTSNQMLKNSQEENSKLVFDLANASHILSNLEKEKDEGVKVAEKDAEKVASTDEATEKVVEQLQQRVCSLEETLLYKEKEFKDASEMLSEAAEELEVKEKMTITLKSSLESSERKLLQQDLMITELESQLGEAKHMIESKGRYLEEREQEIYKFHQIHELRNSTEESDDECNSLEKELKETLGLGTNAATGGDIKSSNDDKIEELEARLEESLALNETFLKKISSTEDILKKTQKDKERLLIKIVNFEETMERNATEIAALQKELEKTKNQNLTLAEKTKAEEEDRNELLQEVENLKGKVLEERNLSQKKEEEHLKELDDLHETLALKQQIEQTLWGEVNDLRTKGDSWVKEKDERQKMEEKCSDLEAQLKELTERLRSSDQASTRLELEKVPLEREVASLKQEIDIKVKDIEEYSNRLLQQSEELLGKDEKIVSLKQEVSTKVSECEEYSNQLIQKSEQLLDKDKRIAQLDECNKIMEEKNLELTTSIECLEASCKNVEDQNEKLISQVNTTNEAVEKLTTSIHQMENYQSKLEDKLTTAEKEKEQCEVEWSDKLKTLLNDSNALKNSLSETRERVNTLSKSVTKSKSANQDLLSRLKEKESTLLNLSAKLDSLDRKLSIAEDEAETLRMKCQVLEKEVAALREARQEEIHAMQETLEQKDQEIATLQQEIKRSLQSSTACDSQQSRKDVTDGTMKEEEVQETSLIAALRKELEMSETERSSLLLQLSTLQGERSTMQDVTRNQEETSLSVSRGRTSRNEGYNISTRTRSRAHSSTSNNNSRSVSRKRETASMKLQLETPSSNVELRTPRQRHDRTSSNVDSCGSEASDKGRSYARGTKSGRGRKKTPKDASSSKTLSSRNKKKNVCRFDLDENIKDDDDDFVPSGYSRSKATTRSTRSSARRTKSKVPENPHLQNKENIDVSRTSKEDSVVDSKDKVSSKPAYARGRRRRPLYNREGDQPFESSPNLFDIPVGNEMSPHTVVRRNLRSKAK